MAVTTSDEKHPLLQPLAAPRDEAKLTLWQRLTEPSDTIREPERRRRVRLLSALLIVLIPLGYLIALVPPLLKAGSSTSMLDQLLYVPPTIGVLALTFAYWLNRTGRYSGAAGLTVASISVMAFASVLQAPENFELVLVYLTIPALLASTLLSARGTVYTTLGNMAGILATAALIPGMALFSNQVINMLAFNLVLSSIMVVAATIRHQDLMQIEQQTAELSEAVYQAELANKLKDQFLANMSHELRTPLNAIIGFTEVMLMGLAGEISEQAKHAIERIHHNSERLLKLIDDILDISKIEAGRVDIIRSPFELSELMTAVEMSIKPLARSKGLEIVTEIDPSLPNRLMGDVKRLEQILLNLTSNAAKFTEEGSVKVSFKRQPNDQWSIIVADTGVGIPPHAQEFIFEKFRQVDGTSRRAYSGSGLGLAIVRELALLMDGTVNVQSKVGSGSTFSVTLPLVDTAVE